MAPEVEDLLARIEEKLSWGDSITWQSRDFDNLNQRILDETGVSLSASTLRRIWGKVEYNHVPSSTTLDTLSRFAGYESWRVFLKETKKNPSQKESLRGEIRSTRKSGRWIRVISLLVIVLGASIGILAILNTSHAPVNPDDYHFSSKPVTHQIPNSVIFTYDATASPTDSVFIQQSWDSNTRTMVDKNQHVYTSIYYEPGFYTAKLFVDGHVVKEHPLLVPSADWLGLVVSQKNMPVYFERGEFMYDDSLHVASGILEKKHIAPEPVPPIVKFYNVGNFEPVSTDDLFFTCKLKNNYHSGAAACQYMNIVLVTDGAPIVIPVSSMGCISELNLRSVDNMVSGKKADLSGFGVDASQWVQVVCERKADKILFYVNDKLAFTSPAPLTQVKIVGLIFLFQGAGSVKDITLRNAAHTVFQAF